MTKSSTFRLEIVKALKVHVPPALVRLGYLHPEWRIEEANSGIEVTAPSDQDQANITREILHALYRERIFAETLPLRKDLMKLLGQ